MKKWVLLAALALIWPSSARADWLLTPNLGTTFATPNDREHFTYGVGLGWMGAGILGWEVDLSYTPEFYEDNDQQFDFIDGSNVVSAMFNVMAGVPLGGQLGPGFRPYFTGGIGLLQSEIQDEDDLFDVDSTDWGFNLGAGAMGFVTDKVGFRGDVRYIRSFQDLEADFDVGDLDYWRATGGITFRW